MAIIQHNINSIAVNLHRIFLGMGNYQLLEIKKNGMECLRKFNSGWEIRTVLVDDKYIYAGSLGQEFIVISKEKFEKVYSDMHKKGVICFSTHDNLVALGGYNTDVKVLKNFEYIGMLKGHASRVNAILITKDYIITGDGFRSSKASIRFFDKTYLKEVKKIKLKDVRVNALAIIDNQLLVGTNSGLHLYNKNDKLTHSLKTDSDVSKISSFNSDVYFASGARLYKMKLSKFADSVHQFRSFENTITSLAADSDNVYLGVQNKLVVASTDLNPLVTYTVDVNGNIDE